MSSSQELYRNRDLGSVLHLLCRIAGFRTVTESHVPRTLIERAAQLEARSATCYATKGGKSYVFSLRLSTGPYENSLRITTVAEAPGDQEAASAAMHEALHRLGEIALESLDGRSPRTAST